MKVNDMMIAHKYVSIGDRCRNKGLPFHISLGELKRLYKRKRCAYTGVVLTRGNASIDRIVPKKGYVKGNLVLCTVEFNGRKGDLTPAEMRSVLAVADKHQ